MKKPSKESAQSASGREAKKERERTVEENLKNIYLDQEGSMPDLTTLEHAKKRTLTRFLVRLLIFAGAIAAVSWIGFFLWQPYNLSHSETIETAIEASNTAISGQAITFTVRYKNIATVPLAALEIKMNLPSGFVLETAQPAPTIGNIWVIGSLSPESDGQIDVTGTFRSAVPSAEKIQAVFTYRPANFSSDFQDIETASVEITDSVVDMELTGPDKALPGDDVTYTVNLQNSGEKAVQNVRGRVTLPQAFIVTSVNPAASLPDIAEWDFATLEPGALQAITVIGHYTSDAAGTSDVKAEAGFMSEDGQFLTQTNAEQTTDILGGNLVFHLIANGSTQDQTAELGDRMRLSVDYANNGNETIEGLAFTLNLSTPSGSMPIDWEAAELADGTLSGNAIVWDGLTREDFVSLDPNASGVFDVTLPLLSELPAGISDAFTMQLNVTLDKVGSVETVREIETAPITVALNSDTSFAAIARYYDGGGTAVGTGPLPPAVGQTTTYRVSWNVANAMHDLADLSVSTNLPPDVAWIGTSGVSLGSIVYNETTRLVTWNLDALPKTTVSAEAWFDVSITPKDSDVGAFFKLTNPTSFRAKDAKTLDILERSADILDTELPLDPLAVGKGIVKE